jgi:hypothetical protein
MMKERSKAKFDELGEYTLFNQPFLFMGFHTKVSKIQVCALPFGNNLMVKVFSRDEQHEYVVQEDAIVSYMEMHDEPSGFHSAVMIVKELAFRNIALHPDEPAKTYAWVIKQFPGPDILKQHTQSLRKVFGQGEAAYGG